MTAIDNLIESLQTDIKLTAKPQMKKLLGQTVQTERLNTYQEMLTRALGHKRRSQ